MKIIDILKLSKDTKVEGFWLSGIKGDGEYKEWHFKGGLYIHCYFKNDVLHGDYKRWFYNGVLADHSLYKKGEKIKVYENYLSNVRIERDRYNENT